MNGRISRGAGVCRCWMAVCTLTVAVLGSAPAVGQPQVVAPTAETSAPPAPAPSAAEPDAGKGIIPVPAKKEPVPARATKGRWALVIGNAAYEQQPLRNPVNDAVDMGALLELLGWEVTVLTNKDANAMKEAISTFINQIQGRDDRLLAFSGHGVQVNEKNYLLPVGRRFDSEQDVIHLAVEAAPVLEEMANRGPGVSVLILDACRDNPLPASARSSRGGLAPINAKQRGTPNSLIMYATAPGERASDGRGRNGTFTAALLEHLPLDAYVGDLLVDVRRDVLEETDGMQTPWESSSLIEKFRFTSGHEPLRVERRGPGQFMVHQIKPPRAVLFETLGSPSQVRKLALNAYAQSSVNWPLTLEHSLLELDEAIGLLAELGKRIDEIPDEVECVADRQRLLGARMDAQRDLANGQPRGCIAGIRAALNQPLEPQCPPGRFWTWRNATLIGAGTVLAASAITATVFFTGADSKWDQAQEACDGGSPCPATSPGPQLSRDAKSAGDTATVFYSISAVALAGGLAAYFFWPPEKEATPGTAWAIPSIDVRVSRSSTELSARVRF